MGKKIKDTQYLAISAQIRAMENRLIRRDQMEQILSATDEGEVLRLVQACGYPDLKSLLPESIDAMLAADRETVALDLSGAVPDVRYVDVFKLKYDYHNVKVLLKARAMGTDAAHMLVDQGRVDANELRRVFEDGDLEQLPEVLREAIREAGAVLDTTRDPQLSDIVLDRHYYAEMLQIAQDTGSAFLQGYVRSQIDAANLRAVVRTIRMGKGAEFLKNVLLPGGDIAVETLLACGEKNGEGLAGVYSVSPLRSAAEEAEKVLHGGELTTFEKLSDDAQSAYLAGAQFVPFGEAPLLAYLAAKETEYTNLRILLMGRMAGLDADVIRPRLRASYV